MSTERYFSTGISKFKPRRRWGRRVLFMVAALLVCWLLSGCQMHGEAPPWLKGTVLGLGTFVMVVVLWRVALWVKRRDDEALDRWSVAYSGEDGQWDEAGMQESRRSGKDLASPSPCEDPLAGPWAGVDRAEVRRILGAAIAEVCEVREIVGRARGNLSVEDYGAGLTDAEHRLHGVSLCLARLSDEFPLLKVPAKKDVEVSVVFDAGRFQESLEKARAATMRFAFMTAQRRQWVRVYLAPAAEYKPAHGGYES